MFKVENIRSIGELRRADGGRNLTPVFKDLVTKFVHVTKEEFEIVRGNEQKMKELAIEKLNN